MKPVFDRYGDEAEFAVQAVRQAGRLCLAIEEARHRDPWLKDDRSPVTLADFASQALVASGLEAAFPADPLVAEEDSARLRQGAARELLARLREHVAQFVDGASVAAILHWIDRGAGELAERFWTLDPVDGTKGLLRGGQYAVALGLIEHSRVEVGALACPHLDLGLGGGSVVVGVRGQGAWAAPLSGGTFVRLRVSRRTAPSRMRLLRSVEADHTDVAKLDRIVARLGLRQEPIRMDSQAKYALLAAGQAELIVRLVSPQRPEYCERIWDQAAGSLLVEEAGGTVSDLRGRRLDFGRGRELRGNLGVLASNGRVHAAALEAIRAVGADRRPGEVAS
ncbi:MAG: inositol monophosphatase family protein [Chloroflexota bacterium]